MDNVLASKIRPKDNATLAFRVTLSHWGGPTPWATHIETIDPETASTGKCWGTYFDDANEAIKDYLERCNGYGLEPLATPERQTIEGALGEICETIDRNHVDIVAIKERLDTLGET